MVAASERLSMGLSAGTTTPRTHTAILSALIGSGLLSPPSFGSRMRRRGCLSHHKDGHEEQSFGEAHVDA